MKDQHKKAGVEMQQARAILVAWAAIAFIGSWHRPAQAADWLDDMPPVAAVIDAVRANAAFYQASNAELRGNEDYLAEQIVGTLVLLRWVIDFEADEDGLMWPSRSARMREIAKQYLQVEYAIALGLGNRRGDVKSVCDRKDSYLNRFGQKMHASAMACYRFRFHISVSNFYVAYAHRKAIFPSLFCDRAPHYLDLVERHILQAPSPDPEPSKTFTLPPDVPALDAEWCVQDGGDADRDGLCDEWEQPFDARQADAAVGGQCPLNLLSLKQRDAMTLDVRYIGAGSQARPQFTLYRSALDPLNRREISIAKVRVANDDRSRSALVTAPASDLRLDESQPWLTVTADTPSGEASVQCRQPIPMPSFAQLRREWDEDEKPLHNGNLFGRYPTADGAALAAEPTLRAYANATGGKGIQREIGALIWRDTRVAKASGGYYVSMPIKGSSGLVPDWERWPTWDQFRANRRRIVDPFKPGVGNWERSENRAFPQSCEDRLNYALVGIMHTHPPGDCTFSPNDWEQVEGLSKDPQFEFSYLLCSTRCIKRYDGRTRGKKRAGDCRK